MVIQNSKGKIFYGMHFYAGLAQYQENGQDPYRVFLNEDTIRSMDPSFAGRPLFVEHVDEVDPDLNQLRKEADGWVVESFYNSADGKHWVKFIVVTDKAERAIRSGMRLSNAYIPKSFRDGGMWNGIPYQKEITAGEYEHLAIVENPRYEESVILTPDEFKQYNEQKVQELKKLSNSQEKGNKMAFSFFKKTKVENPFDADLQVFLPKSGKTVSIASLINEADKKKDPVASMEKKDEGDDSSRSHSMADTDHMVKMHDGSYMKIKDMMSKHKDMMDELEDLKKPKKDSEEKELDLKVEESGVDSEGDAHNDDDEMEDCNNDDEEKVAKEEHNEEMSDDLEHPEDAVHDDEDEDKGAKKKALQLAEHEDKEIEEAKAKNKKKNEGKLKAARLKNAHLKANSIDPAPQMISLSVDRVARGKQLFGSSN